MQGEGFVARDAVSVLGDEYSYVFLPLSEEDTLAGMRFLVIDSYTTCPPLECPFCIVMLPSESRTDSGGRDTTTEPSSPPCAPSRGVGAPPRSPMSLAARFVATQHDTHQPPCCPPKPLSALLLGAPRLGFAQ